MLYACILAIFPDAVNFHMYIGVFVRMLVCIYAHMCIIKDTDKCMYVCKCICRNMHTYYTCVIYDSNMIYDI